MSRLISSEIIINAPIQKVWDVLVDLDNYYQWNTFTPKVITDFRIGSDVTLHVRLSKGKKLRIQKETILNLEEGTLISWGITSSFPAKTERIQQLTKIDSHTTRYYTADKLTGILVPVIMLLYQEKIQHGFDAVALGLKKYSESLQS